MASPRAPTAAPTPVPVASGAPGGPDSPWSSPPERRRAADPGDEAAAEAVNRSGVALTTPRPPYTVSVRRTAPALGTVSELGPVSTNYLSATHRIALEELLHRARFFDLPPRLPLRVRRPRRRVPGDHRRQRRGHPDGRVRAGGRPASRRARRGRVTLLERLAGWQTIQPVRGPGTAPRRGARDVDADRERAAAGRAGRAGDGIAIRGRRAARSSRGGRRDRRRHRDRALRSDCRDGAASATRDRCSPESARRRVAARTDRRVAAARAAAAADGTAAAPSGGTRRRDGPLPTLAGSSARPPPSSRSSPACRSSC